MSATHLYTSATIPVYVGQSCGLCRPQHLFTSANTGTCIGHITGIYMSATIPVYVGQSWDLHRPQYVPTLATTSVYVGQHWDLRRPHKCPGHWPVAFPDSQGPGNPTGLAQCNGPMWKNIYFVMCQNNEEVSLKWLCLPTAIIFGNFGNWIISAKDLRCDKTIILQNIVNRKTFGPQNI